MRYWSFVLLASVLFAACNSGSSQTASSTAPVPTEQEARDRFAKEQELHEWVRNSDGTWQGLNPAGQSAFLEYHQQDAAKAQEHFQAIASTTTFGDER